MKNLKTILLPLLIIVAFAGLLVWMLPVKVTLTVVVVVQVLILVVLGDRVKSFENTDNNGKA